MKALRFLLIKIIAQDSVHQVGLGDLELVGGPLDQFLVVVCNYELLIFVRERPAAYLAKQRASSAGVARRRP